MSNTMERATNIVEWYIGFVEVLSTLGTLGAGFTLTVAVQDKASPTPAGYDASTVTTWAALASILFVSAVLMSQAFGQILKFEQREFEYNMTGPVKWILGSIALVLQALVLSAFLFLELVLMAYAPKVAGVGLGVTAFLALVVLLFWFGYALSSGLRFTPVTNLGETIQILESRRTRGR